MDRDLLEDGRVLLSFVRTVVRVSNLLCLGCSIVGLSYLEEHVYIYRERGEMGKEGGGIVVGKRGMSSRATTRTRTIAAMPET